MRLLAHAEPAHERRGGVVASVRAPVDAVQAERPEGNPEQLRRGLARVSAALHVRMEREPDLALAVLPAAQPQNDVADHPAVVAPLGGQHERVAVLVQTRLRRVLGQQLLDLLPRAHVAVEVAHHLGQRPDGVEVVEIARAERPQEQALGLDRCLQGVHAPILAGTLAPAPRPSVDSRRRANDGAADSEVGRRDS